MANDTITGRAWVFGDDLNTDVIHPPEFFSLHPDKVKKGLFHKLDPTLQSRLEPGDILVGGRNFGCGSSRETSMRSLLLNEVGAIVAVSFARIFFRNATNNGLRCFTFAQPDAPQRVDAGDRLTIDVSASQLRLPSGDSLDLAPTGPFIQKIWAAGGLLNMPPFGPPA